ncbi:oxdD [Symbiodinium sp. CCMP2592]|nr:oxdD [Symbiodinium sp. CCMP2592]
MVRVAICALALCALGTMAQFLPPGTTDVPIPRPGDCGQVGPATYVYRMSQEKPNDYFPAICAGMGGAEVRFNDPCAWAHGQAQMTGAHFTNMCKGATRMIHWHNQADEWGFVSKGRLMTFVASPDGLPWPSSTNILEPRGVWYFPSSWLHGLMCVTPEEEGGCEFTIVFASPQAAEPNGHNLDTTLAQADNDVAATALGLSLPQYQASRPAFGRAEHSIHYSNSNMTAPIVTAVAPGACDPECPPIHETVGAPAAVQSIVEQRVELSGVTGVTLYRIRTDQFPFSRTMSQERTELAPGAVRPVVWTTADSFFMVVSGTVTVSMEGGILGKEAHLAFTNETLKAGDAAYFPNGRAYWFRETTGKTSAETINVFNVGIWKSIELGHAISEMPNIVVMSNLHQAHFAKPVHI